jgi:hypothetical protein
VIDVTGCVPAVALKDAFEGKAEVQTPDLPMHPKEAILPARAHLLGPLVNWWLEVLEALGERKVLGIQKIKHV